MPALSDLLAFVGATVVLLLIPGPAVIYMLNRTLSDGRRVGLAAVAGLEVGDTIQATLAAVGLSAVLATSARAFDTVKWLGVAYLVWTGVRTLLTRPGSLVADDSHVPVAAAFRQGILVNALNPKTGLFFLSIFPQFVDRDAGHVSLQLMVLGCIFAVMALLSDGTWAVVAGTAREWLSGNPKRLVTMRAIGGIVMVLLGLAILVTAPRP